MKTIHVLIPHAQRKQYPIIVGPHVIQRITSLIDDKKYVNSFIITGENTPKSLIEAVCTAIPLANQVITIRPGEKNKNLENAAYIWKKLYSLECGKKSLLINCGGGSVMDMGGFCASVYIRGIDYINIPTSLLAQVDASIGGKTGVHFEGVRNLLGTFHYPIGVIADTSVLTTLSQRELVSGFGEIIKHGLVYDKDYFTLATSKKPGEFTQKELTRIVERSCQIKADVLTRAARKSDNAQILHFGHTIGQCIEALSQPATGRFQHGEATLLGIIVETNISYLLGLLSQPEWTYITEKLEKFSFPKLTQDPTVAIYNVLKLHEAKNNCWTLLDGIGSTVRRPRVHEEVVLQALKLAKGVFT